MQRFECIGRLTKNVELNQTANGVSVAKFGIAVNRKYKNKDSGEREVDFFNCVAWRSVGETIAKYCEKGSKIYLSGEIQTRSYEAQDGTKRYVTELVVNDFEFLSFNNNSNNSNENTNNNSNIIQATLIDNNEELPF